MALQPAIIIIVVISGVVSGQEMCRPNSPRSDCGMYARARKVCMCVLTVRGLIPSSHPLDNPS